MLSNDLVPAPMVQAVTREPLTYSIPEAAAVLGISVDSAEWLIAQDEFPVPLVILEQLTLVSRAQLEEWVGGNYPPATLDISV